MKKLYFLPFALLVVSSCSKINEHVSESNSSCNIISTKSSSDNSNKGQGNRHFNEKMLSDLLHNFFPNKTYKIDIINNSRQTSPIAYIVNFDEDGWAIVAGNVRQENQILAYGETGHFNPTNIDNRNVEVWYKATLSSMESIEFEDEDTASDLIQTSIDYNQPYYWVRLPLDPQTQILENGHVEPLLSTKWGQGQPWNSMTPLPDSEYYSYTGCVAVACAQILYYLKEMMGFSIGLYDITNDNFLYHDGTYTDALYYYYIDSTAFTRSNYSVNSPKWSSMKRNASDNTGSAQYVAELMLDIAQHVGMRFYSRGSGALVTSSLFQTYGINCSESDYDFSLVKNSLNNRIPVTISCWPENSPQGHIWIIDGYNAEERVTDYRYQWRMIPPDSLCFYNNIDYDYVLTESQKDALYPSVEEFEIEHNYNVYYNKYLRMNWGWDGVYDDGYYSISPYWDAGNQHYTSNASIMYNFRQ